MTPGETKKLNVTEKARHRIMCGLGWDPAEEYNFFERLIAFFQKKKTHHDLDLACYLFDQDKKLISSVSAEPGQAIDQTGRIYHSGDNEEGIGEGDDEEISVELKDLDAAIHHIVFTAQIRTGHAFTEIDDCHIRLADGYTNHNFLSRDINDDVPKNQDSYVFCCLSREEAGWTLSYIDSFISKNNAPADQLALLIT